MYRPWAFLLLLTTCISAQTTSSPEEMLRHAVELQQAGDADGAVKAYRAFLAVRPNEVAAHSNLGVLLSHMGRYSEAATEYKKALEFAPGNSGILLNLGLAYYKAGRIPEAAQTFSTARDLAPDNLQTTTLLADCQLRMGQNRDVITLLKPIEEANGENLAIAYMLGMALLRDGQVQEGQQRVDKILRTGDSAESRFLLGSQMLAAQDFPAAVKQFKSAIELNPDLPDLQGTYGLALLNTGDPDAAIDAFHKQLTYDPNHFEANLYLAQILLARKQWGEAEPLVHKALEVRPDSPSVQLELADLDIGKGQLQRAKTTLEALEKLSPKSFAVHERLYQVYSALHLKVQAEHERAAMSRLQPKEADSGPKAGDQAPDFTVINKDSAESATLDQLRHTGPILLVFGSYTCPNFRGAAAILNRLYPEYKNEIPFYLVYIREAHSSQDWASTQNQREGITLQPAYNMEERSDHATMCVRKLHIEFPTLLDTMNGDAEKAYFAWPSKAYLLDSRGRITFSTGLSEQDFKPEQLKAALRKLRTP
jgi:tetratricopeptide (TPR) repeat protein